MLFGKKLLQNSLCETKAIMFSLVVLDLKIVME